MRIRTILAAAAAPAALAAALLGTAAPAAHAATIQQGAWQLAAFGGSSYQATVQQPLNADGSSIFSAKSRTIPVKWKVTKSQSFKFESLNKARWIAGPDGSNINPIAYTSDNGSYSAVSYTLPAGTTINQLTGLQADAAFTGGTSNHGGALRWSVDLGSGPSVFVYYGTGQSFNDSLVQNGNLIADTSDQRVDTSQITGGTFYDTWSHAVSLLSGQTVKDVSLVLDGGWGGDQFVNLSDATVTSTAGSSTFTWPGASASTAVDPSTVPMYVYLSKTAGSTPAAQIDESVITDTQGDSGGQYRTADGMYMYNFPVSNLTDKSASYSIGIMTSSDGTVPIASVGFGIK
jgi:hypothetical protein